MSARQQTFPFVQPKEALERPPEGDATQDWPQSLIEIRSAIGTEATIALVNHFSGLRQIYISRGYKPGHTLAHHIGEVAYKKLTERFGGSKINVPNKRRLFSGLLKREILELRAAEPHLSKRQIATRLGCTEGWVYQVLQKDPL